MDYLGEVICLSLDSIFFGIVLREYLQNKHALSAVQNVPEIESGKKLKELLEGNGGYYPYIAVKGFVKALPSVMRSISNPRLGGVIFRRSVKEHVVSRSSSGFWTESQRTINQDKMVIPFAVLTTKGNVKVEVLDPFAAKVLDLETIYYKFDPSTSGFMEHLWEFFTGVRKIGLETVEEILKEDTLITAVGELHSDGKSLRIQPPADATPFFITTMPLNSLIERIDKKVNICWWLSLGFGVIGLVFCGIIVRKYWKKRLEWVLKEEKRKRMESTRKERRKNVRSPENLSQDKMCVVCQTNPKEVILLPCGHVSLCEDCSEQINDFCPICKSLICNKNPAYIT